MDEQPSTPGLDTRLPRSRRRSSWWSVRLTPAGLFILLLLNLVACGFAVWPLLRLSQETQQTPTSQIALLSQTAQPPSPSPQLEPATEAPTLTPTRTPTLAPAAPGFDFLDGLLILALQEGAYSHLFAYQPWPNRGDGLSLTRLTNQPWDDIHPALSPDGRRLVFSSNRNGYWDLYLLDLASGSVSRVTDSREYDGLPAWSPDGLWLVYETYLEDNLEVVVRAADDPLQEPIRLTIHPAADTAPVWSPLGRQVAFVSDRSGESEIWLVDLDQVDEKLMTNLSDRPLARDAAPAWSPDGRYLAWSSQQDGFNVLLVWDSTQPELAPRQVGSGDLPVWSPDGQSLLAGWSLPNQDYLVAYPLAQAGVMLPAVGLPGWLEGLTWGHPALKFPLTDPYRQDALQTPFALWQPDLASGTAVPGDRQQLIRQDDLDAPYPFFQDTVDESFAALRLTLARQIGWDYLGNLENAYVPLTSPLDPGLGKSWLYTGRAFAANPLPINAGWVVVVREDFGPETYWRIYLRARYQDGSAGRPLRRQPWDFNARFDGGAATYEQGGRLTDSIPEGYWYDLTHLAGIYGWQRLPALTLWRSAFPAARFNEFVFSSGLTWEACMLEIYPPEALLTPTSVVAPTRTLTPTPRWYQSPTPTETLTPRPTLTPLPPSDTPAFTEAPTELPSATVTPRPSLTPSPTP